MAKKKDNEEQLSLEDLFAPVEAAEPEAAPKEAAEKPKKVRKAAAPKAEAKQAPEAMPEQTAIVEPAEAAPEEAPAKKAKAAGPCHIVERWSRGRERRTCWYGSGGMNWGRAPATEPFADQTAAKKTLRRLQADYTAGDGWTRTLAIEADGQE